VHGVEGNGHLGRRRALACMRGCVLRVRARARARARVRVRVKVRVRLRVRVTVGRLLGRRAVAST